MLKISTKYQKLIFWLILFAIIAFVAYFNRWIFVYKFEPAYWENFYYESQWNIPNSNRVIPDEGVYRYIGYRLVNGENPFNVDYWVPPLGKYLYGVSAQYLQNPYLTSFAFYLLALLIFGLISKELFKSTSTRWLTIYLFALNPLLIEQIQQTMLDLPMTVFLLLSLYSLFKSAKDKTNKFTILSGLALGLMAGTKPAYFVPMITLVSLGYLYFSKSILSWIFFLPSIVLGYIGAYFCYFISHPNPLPWIKLHQKIIDFQKNSGGSHDWINILRTIFTSRYQGFWEGAKASYPLSWSIILPLGTLSFVYIALKRIKESVDGRILLLSIFGITYILMNFTIDFWPRYLVPLIPICTLVLGYIFQNKRWLLVLLIIFIIPPTYMVIFPNSNTFQESFNSYNKSGLYKETYQMLHSQNKAKMNQEDWLKINEQIKSKDSSVLIQENKVKLIKEHNQWKLDWQ